MKSVPTTVICEWDSKISCMVWFEFFFSTQFQKLLIFIFADFCWLCVSWHSIYWLVDKFYLDFRLLPIFFIFPECYFFAYVMSGFFNQVLYSFFYNWWCKRYYRKRFFVNIELKTNEIMTAYYCTNWSLIYIVGGSHKPRSH